MKIYLISLAVGVLVGVIYGVLNVRSPAPPVVALVGLQAIVFSIAWRRGPRGSEAFSGLTALLAEVVAVSASAAWGAWKFSIGSSPIRAAAVGAVALGSVLVWASWRKWPGIEVVTSKLRTKLRHS